MLNILTGSLTKPENQFCYGSILEFTRKLSLEEYQKKIEEDIKKLGSVIFTELYQSGEQHDLIAATIYEYL
jgi:hypothetical protein